MRRALHLSSTERAVRSQLRLRSAIAPTVEIRATPALRCALRSRADSFPASQLGMGQRLLELLVFEAGCSQQVRHPHRLTGVCGGERGVEGDASNVAAGDRETRETIDFERIDRRLSWENPAPDLRPLRLIRKRKLHNEPQPAQESRI